MNKNYLINSMETLLDEYDYEYNTDVLETIIDEWYRQKAGLIELFKKHPNYIEGQYMIAFDTDYFREVNHPALHNFSYWLMERVVSMVGTLPEEIDRQRMAEHCGYLPSELYDFLDALYRVADRTISEELCAKLERMAPAIHPHVGQKTSRVMNKLFTYLGYSKHPEYNREFAKYADALNPLTIKRHTILSLNPLDYLTMSFGNSWASCHTIDKENKRDMPNSYEGQYSSGTMSYMLDPSSMVFYTVDKAYDGTEYWTQPKINRQMFHYAEDKLVQGRLYPQDNDGYKDEYTGYRNLVQEIMAQILGVPNLWTLRIGTSAASQYVYSRGTHYTDYCYYSNCSLSTLKGSENESYIDVGAEPICIECGCRHDRGDNINHCAGRETCACCGNTIYDADDVYWVHDDPYCGSCAHYCDHCGEYFVGDGTWIESERRYVCDRCLEDYIYCDECEKYHHEENVTYVESEDRYVCDECLSENFTVCRRCGEYHRTSEMIKGEDWFMYCEECHEALSEEEAC